MSEIQVFCMRCKKVLNSVSDNDGKIVEWRHGGLASIDSDHSPIPIPTIESMDNPEIICDFCSGQKPIWSYPCETFSVDQMIVKGEEAVSVEGWAACQICSNLVEYQNWDELIKRVIDTLKERCAVNSYQELKMRFYLRELYAKFDSKRKPRRLIGV